MADQVVQVAAPGTGAKIDVSELTVSSNTVERQRVNISDPTAPAAHAGVTNAAPVSTDYGLIVRNIPSAVTYATYSASKAAGAGAASCTDVATLIGSATKTVYVTRFILSATIATAAVLGTVALIKRSAADTTGTSTTTTAVPLDANSAAATAVCSFYTVNPGALGTAVGNVRTWRYWFQLAATATTTPLVLEHTFASPVVLRGVAQNLACNLTTSANACVVDVTFEWFEL